MSWLEDVYTSGRWEYVEGAYGKILGGIFGSDVPDIFGEVPQLAEQYYAYESQDVSDSSQVQSPSVAMNTTQQMFSTKPDYTPYIIGGGLLVAIFLLARK